jgi:hypothetical protein
LLGQLPQHGGVYRVWFTDQDSQATIAKQRPPHTNQILICHEQMHIGRAASSRNRGKHLTRRLDACLQMRQLIDGYDERRLWLLPQLSLAQFTLKCSYYSVSILEVVIARECDCVTRKLPQSQATLEVDADELVRISFAYELFQNRLQKLCLSAACAANQYCVRTITLKILLDKCAFANAECETQSRFAWIF